MAAEDKDRLDEWLDAALKGFTNVEPRMGLEGRIMANLAARDRSVSRRRWALSFGTVAILAVMSFLVWFGHKSHQSEERVTNPRQWQTLKEPQSPAAQVQLSADRERPQVWHRPSHRHERAGRNRDVEIALASPRLQQFPSQRSLSEQEQLLLTYVRRFPKEAVEVAREQTEREKELEVLYSNGTAESNFDQER